MLLSFFRAMILYLVLIFVIRAMGKRQIGQMEPAEFVVTMLVANLASIPMQDGAIPLYSGLVPILTVLGVELLVSQGTAVSLVLRRVFCGKPVILIDNGRVLGKNLRKTRVTLDELSGHLRQKDVLSFSDVQFAILETNGEISVFPYPRARPASAEDAGIEAVAQSLPITLVEDGKLLRGNLPLANKTEDWVLDCLKSKNTDVESTLLLTVDGDGHIFFAPREAEQ